MIKNKVVIFLEGGLIQRIESDQSVEVVILDYDTEGGDEERVQSIRDVDGTPKEMYISHWYIESDPETVKYFFGQVNEEENNEKA